MADAIEEYYKDRYTLVYNLGYNEVFTIQRKKDIFNKSIDKLNTNENKILKVIISKYKNNEEEVTFKIDDLCRWIYGRKNKNKYGELIKSLIRLTYLEIIVKEYYSIVYVGKLITNMEFECVQVVRNLHAFEEQERKYIIRCQINKNIMKYLEAIEM